MKCLRDNRFENALCRNESKDYLECRMERQVHAGNYDFRTLQDSRGNGFIPKRSLQLASFGPQAVPLSLRMVG